jgi:hypothetical protein
MGEGFLPAVATLGALLRRWLGRATAGVVLKERVSLEMGDVKRDDMAMAGGSKSYADSCWKDWEMELHAELERVRKETVWRSPGQWPTIKLDRLEMRGA